MTAALEDIKILEIDEWGTLATAPSPTKLQKGQSPDMKNVWVDEKPGSVITAPGLIKVGTLPSGNPCTFCINYFKTSAGTQTFICSDNSTVWATTDFQNFTSLITGLSSSFQLRGAVIRDKIWLTNGSDAVRTYDGSSVVVLDGTGGTPNVPKGRYIAYHDERVWLYHVSGARSQSAFSALTDSAGTVIAPDNANAWPSSNTLQISEGDADFGTGLLLYRGYLHFFKQYSIWRLVGYDEYTYSRVKTRASTGTRFNESLAVLDSLVHMIGIDGIYVFDGEETARISDIIDPATASQTAFGFNQLQQPNTNNQFWEVSSTTDWNTGTVPTNLTVSNDLEYKASDDSQADFLSGTLTNTDATTNPGVVQLALAASGGTSINVSQGKTASRTVSGSLGYIGSDSQITDGDLTNNVGFINSADGTDMAWTVDLGSAIFVGSATLKGFYAERFGSTLDYSTTQIEYSTDNVNWTSIATVTLPAPSTGNTSTRPMLILTPSGNGGYPYIGPTDLAVTFSGVSARYWRYHLQANGGGRPSAWVMTELQFFQAGFVASGNFISKTLDLGAAPNSLGNFAASYSLNAGTLTFYTQTSSDGSSWDARVAATPGSAIGSTPKRYIRWQADFTNGTGGGTSPTIDAVFLPSLYLSAIHDTGGSIYAWGPIESDRTLPLQVIYYYRTATTSGGVASATWRTIVPGGVISDSVANQYVQFKLEILNNDATHLPVINSVTINWVKGSGTQVQTLQNVAAYAWRNRYWLSAAGPGATANNTILVRGKKTFGSPWMLKDFQLLSFTRYQDALYAGSSVDGSIYQIDTGYSNNGAAIDSYFQTGDFTFGGFYINPIELLIEVERKGPYNLAVGFSIDRGNTWTEINVDLTISTFAQSYVKRWNMPTTNCDRIRFRVRTDGADKPFEVHNMRFYYKLEAPRGSIK